jgi:hypothetical protein
MQPVRPDFSLGHFIALETVPKWAFKLLGRKVAFFPPGTATWWPESYDGVHLFRGPRGDIIIGDWSGRWWRPALDEWGADLVRLIATLRGCNQTTALRWLCTEVGIRDMPRIAKPWDLSRHVRAA